MIVDGANLFRTAFLDGLRPDALLEVSQWADLYRVLVQKSSNESGPYRVDRTPYVREVMDCLSVTSPVRLVVCCWGSQVGKSELGNCWVGYVMDHAPAPMLIVVPRKEDAAAVSQQRIDPMIESCERLRQKVHRRRERDNRNNTFIKDFPGGILKLVGANAPAGLRAMPAKYAFGDEIDEWPGNVGGEGDPVKLIERRMATFRSNSKLYLVSSPKLEGRSRIWKAYQRTDRCVYVVPCPLCGFYQEITFRGHIRWDENDPKSVRMECEECKKQFADGHKEKMLAAGHWFARELEAPAGVRGFHLNALYSPLGWYSWQQAVEDFLAAKKDRELLKVFVNTVLAEPYKQLGDAPEWDRLYERRETYPMWKVPAGGLFLTMGIDVQGDRLEFEIVAWGRNLESWSIGYVVLPGKPSETQVWIDLSREASRAIEHESGATLPIRAVGIDCRFATQDCYRWVRNQPLGRVFALNGTDDGSALIGFAKPVEVQHQGKRLARGLKLWQVGGPVAKHELYSFLRLPKPVLDGEPFPPGYCHFPEYGHEYFQQLTAEHIDETETKQGYTKYEWVKTRERNEALDCRVYARAAAAILGVDRYVDATWAQLESSLGTPSPKPAAPEPERPKKPPREGGGYLSRWQSPRR